MGECLGAESEKPKLVNLNYDYVEPAYIMLLVKCVCVKQMDKTGENVESAIWSQKCWKSNQIKRRPKNTFQ